MTKRVTLTPDEQHLIAIAINSVLTTDDHYIKHSIAGKVGAEKLKQLRAKLTDEDGDE